MGIRNGRRGVMPEERSIRGPVVAGQFYAGTEEALLRQVESCYTHPLGPGKVPQVLDSPMERPCGFVVPHAGYVYSGPVAAHAYASLASLGRPEVAVILGPNHHALHPPLALSPCDGWQTPFGELAVDSALGERLASEVPMLSFSDAAHRLEHSVEVQLPFLQHLYGASLKILPVVVADQSVHTCRALGRAMAGVLGGASAVVLASSDFSHYVPADRAAELDRYALEAILALDPERLGREVETQGLTMWGWGPAMVMLECMGRLGATEAHLLKYANSGDVSGDRGYVVAYAAVQVGPV